jgi:hypothetical protein
MENVKDIVAQGARAGERKCVGKDVFKALARH